MSAVDLEKTERPGRLERLELVQKDTGEIVLQADDGGEPLLQLRFNRKLTQMLGADALSLAQAMVETASYVFEYANDSAEQPTSSDFEDPADTMIHLRTTPLH